MGKISLDRVTGMYGKCKSEDDVKKRRRELMKENHPDSNKETKYSIDDINEGYQIACEVQIWVADRVHRKSETYINGGNLVITYEEYKKMKEDGFIVYDGERVELGEIRKSDRDVFVGIPYVAEVYTKGERRQYKGEIFHRLINRIYTGDDTRYNISYKTYGLKDEAEIKLMIHGKEFNCKTTVGLLRFAVIDEEDSEMTFSVVMDRKIY